MKRIAATLALTLAGVVAAAAPAFARDSYVVDNAGLFSAATIASLNQKIGDFNAQTHKEVFVDTEPTVGAATAQAAAERIFAQQQVNGVLIYIAKSPKTVGVVPDRTAQRYFPSGSTAAIRTAIVNGFNSGNFDGGITNGVDLTLNMYRSHIGTVRTSYAQPVAVTETRSDTGGGFQMHWILWLIVLAVIFFIIRGIFRAMSGPRMMPPGYGGGPGPMGYGGGPGYGPGYGGGYGGGGGGSFFSGLLGGLGGAFLGNELFGNRGNETIIEPGQQAGIGGDLGGNAYGGDQSGFQSDPGQADMGNSSFGGWGGGDSGGGGGWGGGDSGGGGGDWGGGGGDSGGGGW
jgi:uncharacterized protein